MSRKTILLIVVASLGYFVDIYDLVLFNVVKAESLKQILPHAADEELKNTAFFLFNMQMTGMLIGGLLWGILGDKMGRLTVLFGSILLYSAANIANAFTFSIPLYAFVRVVAGIGLAGELGAGITMVSETMSREKRGYGTMIIVTFGALGAVAAALVGDGKEMGKWVSGMLNIELAPWQVAYLVGGVMGLLLLLLRVGTIESKMFSDIKHDNVKRGDIFILFKSHNFPKYLKCILIGIPIWYMIGLLVANSQSIFAPEMGISNVNNGTAIMYTYLGLSAGDLVSGILSQVWRSRKKVVMTYLVFSMIMVVVFLFFCQGISVNQFYLVCFIMGCGTGYWAIFVTIAAEQFGTNIRSTVTNTVPNFVRGSVPLITSLFGMLTAASVNNTTSALLVGIVCIGLAMWAIITSSETFSKDLDYVEKN